MAATLDVSSAGAVPAPGDFSGFRRLQAAVQGLRAFLATAAGRETRPVVEAGIAALERRADRYLVRAGFDGEAALALAEMLADHIVQGDGLPDPLGEADLSLAWACHEALLGFAAAREDARLAVKFYGRNPKIALAREAVRGGHRAPPPAPRTVVSVPAAPPPADAEPVPPLPMAAARVTDAFRFVADETPRPPPPLAPPEPPQAPAPLASPGPDANPQPPAGEPTPAPAGTPQAPAPAPAA